MNKFKISNFEIGGPKTFVIAEIGQNHQGDLDIAKRMIFSAKFLGVDCVKFQKSSLPDKFTKSALKRPYIDPNSWAMCYGDHKAHLEFTIEQHHQLKVYAENLGLIYSASAMDNRAFDELCAIAVPFIKIGSGDANNILLLQHALDNHSEMPLIISTGMQSESSIRDIYQMMIDRRKTNFALLHCVSAYPTDPEDCQLRMIEKLYEWFPETCIGYSGHELGIEISLAAVGLGAKIIERHFTFDKSLKGSDHKSSLIVPEMSLMVQWIRNCERLSLPTDTSTANVINYLKLIGYTPENEIIFLESLEHALKPVTKRNLMDCELKCYEKLGKSLVYKFDLEAGHSLTVDDICIKVSDPMGLAPSQYDLVMGRQLKIKVQADDPIQIKHFP